MSRITDRQTTEPSAFNHFLATNYSIGPDYVVHGPGGDVIAAKWHRPASHCAVNTTLAQHTLMYHVGGSTSVAKFVEGRCVGTAAQHGSLTFSPRDECQEWDRGGVCEVMHVYIEPSLIQAYADENLACSTTPEVDPLFAVHDPWLQSYFMLLHSEFGTFCRDTSHPDSLLLTQSIELLIRHLVCWHSNVSQNGRRRLASPATPRPLAPRQLSRVFVYMESNIDRDITLSDLARLVSVSKYHFIRSFRAATQRTPYAYLVERRLALAVSALKNGKKSIEQVACEAGFQSTAGFSSVFRKHYGMSPSRFRAQLH
jgi:AraC family transcriptional regulator